MGTIAIDRDRLIGLFSGHPEALDFLVNYWGPYVHEVDDIVDGDRTSAEDIIATFTRAALVYSHPFYLKNLLHLRGIVLMISNTFADSVAFERSKEPWHNEWADHYRHVGIEMTLAVAQLCGGWDVVRSVSKEIRTICHVEHHDREGKTT